MNLILVLLITQGLFSTGDLMARHYMATLGFTPDAFLQPWFLFYFLLRTVAMFGQLYLFTQFGLGKNIALFGALAIVLSGALGYLLLGEILTTYQYVGITLAILAFLVLALAK